MSPATTRSCRSRRWRSSRAARWSSRSSAPSPRPPSCATSRPTSRRTSGPNRLSAPPQPGTSQEGPAAAVAAPLEWRTDRRHPPRGHPVQLLRRGDTGPAVAEIQAALAGLGLLHGPPPHAEYDEATEHAARVFQQRRGLSVDGLVGAETYRAITAARYRLGDRLLSLSAGHLFVGDDVAALQDRLLELGFDAGRADGVFGSRTEAALKSFQREYGLLPDGSCGPQTLRALRQLGRLVVGGRPQQLRESEALHRSGSSLAGKIVVIDPGHGGSDRGAVGNGLEEA